MKMPQRPKQDRQTNKPKRKKVPTGSRKAIAKVKTAAISSVIPAEMVCSAEVNDQAVQVVTAPPDPELVALAELDKKLLVARDRIRMVARGETPGFYWHGRPGTCKTHTVLTVLEEMNVKYHYHKGNITQGGLLLYFP